MRLFLIPNALRPRAVEFALKLARVIVDSGHSVSAFSEFGAYLDRESLPWQEGGKADMAVVAGGDGTVLRAAMTLPPGVPVWAVNFGHMGYLTDCEPGEAESLLPRIFSGDYNVEERIAIDCRVGEKSRAAFNEAVIHRTAISRALTIDFYINQKPVRKVKADGIIAATPTGSTAYNLSAGGPILMPRSDKIAVTSICPYIFNMNSMVVNGDDEIAFKVHLPALEEDEREERPMLVLDSLIKYPLEEGDVVKISKSRRTLKLVKTRENDFYNVLKAKLAKD